VQKDGQSGFAWVIAQDNQPLWRGLGLAPGPIEDMYSGRAEAFGILAALIFLQYYLSCYPVLTQPIQLNCFCDNLGVITNLTEMQQDMPIRPNDTTADDRDIYLAITATANKCQPVTLQYEHVKGHQDKDKNRPLTTAELHNVECDKLAKAFVRDSPLHSTDLGNPDFEVAQPTLKIDGKVICHRFLPAL